MTHELSSEEFPVASTGTLLLPLGGSLLLTGAIAAFVCQPPSHPLPLMKLLGLAAVYLVVAAFAHAGAVWLVQRVFQDELGWSTRTLIAGLWSTVAWLPFLTLLTSQDSLWIAATLPWMASCAVAFLKRSSAHAEDRQVSRSFLAAELVDSCPFWRALLPSALASAALEGGVCALALQHPWIAGLLLAASMTLPVGRLVSSAEVVGVAAVRPGRWMRDSFCAWILTAIALVPLSSSGLLAKALLRSREEQHPGVPVAVLPKKAATEGSGSLAFVVLLQPAHAKERPLPPAPAASSEGRATAAPQVIPFDGPYWFFKHPGEQPGVMAHRERGDPRKINIRSTDGLPMLMEAHQALAPAVALESVHVLRLDLTNADDRPGTIGAEVVLEQQMGGKLVERSLGTLTLPSSEAAEIPLGRAPVQESLSFLVPEAARRERLEAITVRFKPDRSRSLGAPLVAVRGFVLQP